MGQYIERIEFLLLIAAVVAMLARRLKIPYTVGLVLAGIALAIVPFAPAVELTKELILTIFLPPLIFEAALYLRWSELRRDLPVIATLATLGVLLSAGVTALGMWYGAGWDWQSALVFGVLIAATDPVSVIATFKESGVRGRLRLLMEAESLFNDGTAAVAFGIVVALAMQTDIGLAGAAVSVGRSVAGGVISGLLVGGAVLLLAGRTDEHLIELTLSTVAAYGSFLLAENLGASGVLATLTAGLLTGNVGSLGSFTDKGREAVLDFWEYVVFLVNSLVFMLIGIVTTRQGIAQALGPTLIAVGAVIVGRAVAVYPSCALFARSTLRVAPRHQHALFWGGLRGALALALALGLPPGLPRHDEIIAVTFGVVACSILVQGLTMTPLLRSFKEISD
jgi:CPA1 family monovalent cation:H+ antiporter